MTMATGHWWRYRLLLRPYALAHRRGELAFASGCVASLILVFVAEVWTPDHVVVGALGLVPLVAAAWTLSSRFALAVGGTAVGLYVVTALRGDVDGLTVVVEIVAYSFLGLVTRLYAGTLADMLQRKARGRGPRVPTSPRPALGLFLEPGREPATGVESLTDREREVATLALTGRTAREIGEVLHIGERTVETHLGNTYAKLGVRGRLELIQRAGRLKF